MSKLTGEALTIPIPNPGHPLFDERVTLNGIDYVLYFDWNSREERWYMTVKDAEENVITAGIKLVSDWPLYSRETRAGSPSGNFMVDDPAALPPQLADFGIRSVLLYYVAAV